MRPQGPRNTRQRILEAAETAFGNEGYSGTRLHHIAERVGVQKASLFHYFTSKEHLYCAVLDEGAGQAEEIVKHVLESEGEPIDKIRALLRVCIDMVVTYPERTKIQLRQSLGDAPPGFQPTDASERMLCLVADLVASDELAKSLSPIDPFAFVLGLMGMVAFFFTSGPVVAPSWFGQQDAASVRDRIERHVNEVMERCLDGQSHAAKSSAVL